MQRTRWTVMALVIPTIAAVAIACDQRTPTEVQRLSASQAGASFNHDDDGDDRDGDDRRLRAEPFVFVGTVEECGVPGSPIVTSAWLSGMGLPDGGDDDLNVPTNPANRDGLLLNKNGVSVADCSSSGARIRGVRGMVIDADFTLGFDYRDGGHCGAGAPRFNVSARAPDGTETFHFVGGCGNDATPEPAPQDAANWSRVRFTNPVGWFPPAVTGSRIQSISILYDEGTDTPSENGKSLEPSGIGLAVIDNIFIDGRYIRRGQGIAEPRGNRRGDRDEN
jgi:hypothetical protein